MSTEEDVVDMRLRSILYGEEYYFHAGDLMRFLDTVTEYLDNEQCSSFKETIMYFLNKTLANNDLAAQGVESTSTILKKWTLKND